MLIMGPKAKFIYLLWFPAADILALGGPRNGIAGKTWTGTLLNDTAPLIFQETYNDLYIYILYLSL